MKKSSKQKNSPVIKSAKPDVADLLMKMQEQLAVLERQMNIIVSRLPERSSYTEPRPQQPQRIQPPQQSQYNQQPPRNQSPQQYNDNRQNNNFRERTLYKVICADCHNECEIPFKPSGDRPVYCKNCFAKRKQGGNGFFKGNNPTPVVNNEPKTIYAPATPPTPITTKPEANNDRKASEKRKSPAKKRKK